MKNVVIAGAARTPMGGFQGAFSGVTAAELGGVAIKAALDNSGADAADIQELLMGCVLPAGQGQAPARQAGFAAGLGEEVPATTLNKMCGSGMKTYILPKMRAGARIGHGAVVDHMFLDGLEDAYDKGRLMGTFAEDCADSFQFTREAQDDYALKSLSNALDAQKSGAFEGEIFPVTVKTRRSEIVVAEDEQPGNARPDKIPTLKPAFRKDGTVTPANSSSISDGAAALVIASEEAAKDKGLTIRARILGHASHAQAPGLFTTAPVPAAQKLLDKLGWSKDDVDLWEVNEAFAVVPMAFMHEMGLERDKVNVNGGACALGHPIGASGTRIMVTLLNALEKRGLKRGVAAICIGGGEGTAIAIELV